MGILIYLYFNYTFCNYTTHIYGSLIIKNDSAWSPPYMGNICKRVCL